jgi:NitT/TauT family transport system substrate-binding protein
LSAARIAVPDLISNSYFPAIAVIVLDLLNREGLDVVHELVFPNDKACHRVGGQARLSHSCVHLAVAYAAGIRGPRVVDRHQHRALLRHRIHRADRCALGAERTEFAYIVGHGEANECCLV